MKKVLLFLLINVSTALAGGGGSGLTQTFAECQNSSNEKLSIIFNENSGYYLHSDKKIDKENFFLNAKTWEFSKGSFQIIFNSTELNAIFETKGRPFQSNAMNRVGQLTVMSSVYSDLVFMCAHY